MKKIMKGFVVDLDEGRPFCSECRQDAHKMDLGEYKAYICTNHACPNTNELRHYSDDSWESADAGEIWGEENVQAVLLTLLDKTYTGPME